MRFELADELTIVADGMGAFLLSHLEENNGFQARTFYAEAFALKLLNMQGKLSSKVENILRNIIDAKDPFAIQFHGEFLQYPQENWRDYPLKNIAVTNWVLLKYLLKIRHGIDRISSTKVAKNIITQRQMKSGFIKDDLSVRSFQYHCFSLALIYELWQETEDDFFRRSFKNGLRFIKKFISSDGSSLYIGRGQEQLFGYASLIYVLSVEGELNFLKKVISYLRKFSRDDGSFPLVLREGEEKTPFDPDLKSEKYLGWYGYNNYFDYLAFAGYFLQKAADSLSKNIECEKTKDCVDNIYFDHSFCKVNKKSYEAVVALPGGFHTNELVFPYIISSTRGRLTPCYGGEEVLPSLFNKIDSPLPYFSKFNCTMRDRCISWMSISTLHLLSPLGYMRRGFQFHDHKIEISTSMRSFFRFKHQYLFFDDVEEINQNELHGRGYKIISDKPMKFDRFAFSPLGRLKVYHVDTVTNRLLFEIAD